jgi:hypothetical protein
LWSSGLRHQMVLREVSNYLEKYTASILREELGNLCYNFTRYQKLENRNAYRILVDMPEGKRPLGRPRRRWVDNIKMDLR